MARQTPVNAGYTIINGTGTGINGDRIDVWLEYCLGEPNVTENYTPFTVHFYTALAEGQTSGTALNYGMDSALKVDGADGNTVSNGAYSFTDPAHVNVLGSFSGNVYHRDDGTKELLLEGSFTTRSTYISGGYVSATVELPSIAKASTLGATDADIGKTSIIAVSVKSNAYCHSIAYAFGSLNGFITADGQLSDTEVTFTTTAIPFVIPESFYYEIPDTPSGQCTLTCKTYQEDTPVGDPQTACFTVTAPEAECGPLLTGTAEDIGESTLALTGDATVLIPGFSAVRCVLDCQGRKGAAIVQMQVNGVAVEENTVVLEQATQIPEFSVTDSRGYTARFTPSVTMIPYFPVTNNASVSRDDLTSGNVTVTLRGSFYEGHFGIVPNKLFVAYALNGVTVTVEPELQMEKGVYTGSFSISGLDYTKAHGLTVVVGDFLADVPLVLTVQKGMPVFDWGENDFRFHVPVQLPELYIGDLTLADYIRQIMQSGG